MSGDWPTVALGTLLTDIQPGFASGRHNSEGEGIPHFRPMNVSTDGRIERAVMKYVDPSAGRPDIRLSSGDILFNNTNSPELVGKTALFDDDDSPAFSNHMTRLRVDGERLDAKYAALRLHQAWREGWFAAHCNNHVSQASIGRDVLKGFEIELPPLGVQCAIASLNDATDKSRSSASNHLSAAQIAIERFRLAVLAAAYREAAGDDESERRVTLADVVREPLKNGHSARPVAHETPFRVLTLTATTSGHFDGSHFKYTDESFPQDSPVWLRPGDIVIQRGNTAEYVGVPALYDGEPNAYLYPDLMIRARVREDIDPRFVWYMLLAPQARQYLRERATGSAGNMPKINQKVLNTVPVPLPDSETRSEIVSELDAALDLAAGIEGRLRSATTVVDRTSQAVLAKAFRGELISNGISPES